jgi:hypothetical protein
VWQRSFCPQFVWLIGNGRIRAKILESENGRFSVWLKRNAREKSAAAAAKFLVRELILHQCKIV